MDVLPTLGPEQGYQGEFRIQQRCPLTDLIDQSTVFQPHTLISLHLQTRPDTKNRASKVSSMNRSLSRTHTPSCLLPWPLMPCHPNTSGDIAKLSASLTLRFSPNIQHHLSRFLWWVLSADRGSWRYSHLHYPFPPYKSWGQTADFSLWDLWTRMMTFSFEIVSKALTSLNICCSNRKKILSSR